MHHAHGAENTDDEARSHYFDGALAVHLAEKTERPLNCFVGGRRYFVEDALLARRGHDDRGRIDANIASVDGGSVSLGLMPAPLKGYVVAVRTCPRFYGMVL